MTEEQIELRVEKMIDALDEELIPPGARQGTMTQEEYDRRLAAIDAWAERMRKGA